MSLMAIMFRIGAGKNDKARDAAIPIPQHVTMHQNISYGPYGKENRLDVYYPEGTTEKLPTIVSIHGGGYVYGCKEIYQRYCMDLARRGFAVVNFNYRLAPESKFPAPLEDTNTVLTWLCKNADQYYLDPERVILVGDSAGAQLTSHYAAIYCNPAFAELFDFKVPAVTLRALGLNCGMYDLTELARGSLKGLHRDYLGRKHSPDDPRLQVLQNIGSNYPPCYIMTAANDFLKDNAKPMQAFLNEKGVETVCKCYGTPEQKEVAHVFHVNILHPEAILCNDEQCDFFRNYV